MESKNTERVQKLDGGRRKVLRVKDSSVQTTPPNSPFQHRHARGRSQPEVTAGSKVNGSATPEFRTVVNVFDDRLQRDSSEIVSIHAERPGVVMDTDSLQSTAAAATDNGRRVYSNKLRRTNGLHPTSDKLHNSKGSYSRRLLETIDIFDRGHYCGRIAIIVVIIIHHHHHHHHHHFNHQKYKCIKTRRKNIVGKTYQAQRALTCTVAIINSLHNLKITTAHAS